MATAGYVDVDVFIPEILQYVHGAPSIMVRIHVVNTLINFCERTFVLKKDPSEISLDEDVHTYTMAFCNDRYVAVAVDLARIGEGESKQPLAGTTEKEMDEEFHNWRSHENTEPTRFWLTNEVNGIRFWPTPNADVDDDMFLKCVVRPRRNQTEFDELLYEKWNEAITAGALAELLLIPGASWFNSELARAFELKYRRWINRARKTTIAAPGKYPGRVIPQNFETIGGDQSRSTVSWV